MTLDQLETVEANAIAYIAALDLILDTWPDDEGTLIERAAAERKRDWARTEIRRMRAAQQRELEF